MLDESMLYGYCDELLRIAYAGNRVVIPQYGIGIYRNHNSVTNDVFISMGASEEYAIAVVSCVKL